MSLIFDDLRGVTVCKCISYIVCVSTIWALCQWSRISSSRRSFRCCLHIDNSQLVKFALS